MNLNTNSKIIKNTSWIVIGRIFQYGLTLLTTLLVTRYLGPEKMGTIGYAFSYVAIFSSFCTLGMNDIVVKELLSDKDNKDKILGTILLLRFLSSLLSVALIFVVVSIMSDNPFVITAAMLQSLSLVFQTFDTINYFYHASLLSKKTAIVNIIAYSLSTIFRIVGLYIKKDLEWFAFAVSLDYLLVALLLLFIYFKDGNKLSFSFNVGKKLLSKSYNYIFASIMIAIYSKADTLLLGKMIDETSVGYYTAATNICNAWPFILQSLIDSVNPIIINLHKENKNEYYKRIKQLYASIFYIGLFVAVGITLFGEFAIKILYGTDYLPSIVPLKIFCWSTIFAYLGVARSAWMQCEDKYHYEKKISLFGTITNVLLNVVLIRYMGINGAALALVLTQFLTNVVYIYLIKDTRENARLMLDGIMLKGIK